MTFRFDFSILFPKIMLKDHTLWKEKISSLDLKELKNYKEHNKINGGIQQFFFLAVFFLNGEHYFIKVPNIFL